MCGIIGFVDRLNRPDFAAGQVVYSMLEALACRGPDGSGAAVWGPGPTHHGLKIRVLAPRIDSEEIRLQLGAVGVVVSFAVYGETVRIDFWPQPGVTPEALERALDPYEVLSLGESIDLVKQAGPPWLLEEDYAIIGWKGPMAIGHTRMSTESKIDLSHSQPFWAHGVPDLAFVHNGHITNYHQLRRCYEQEGVRFYTGNDSEVIGVYLRDRLMRGRSLEEALHDSVADLDGAFSYIVGSPEGLGIVRDRFGLKPLMLAETDEFLAVATEEVALRNGFAGNYRVFEPPPGSVRFEPSVATAAV